MKNSFFVLVSVVDVVEVVLVTVVDVEVVVELKSDGSPVSLFEGSAKSIGSSWKFIHDELSLLELFECALFGTVTCVSFWYFVIFELGVLVVLDGKSAEIEFLKKYFCSLKP